ncbi:MAG: 3-hydroxyacyl-CoA dehydrogenase family protein [Bacteroidota bacterium]
MQIAVLANDEQWKELVEGCDERLFTRLNSVQEEVAADAYIILEQTGIDPISNIRKPVVFNSVIKTLAGLNAAKNVLRINGWNGFIQRRTWEIAGIVTEEVKQIFIVLNRQYIEVADEPGLIAARSIAMIANEAYFALAEEVSTKAEIDVAMKLGTNYPYGPFEWAEKIGVSNIYDLLKTLSANSKRYLPSSLLEKEATA